MKWIAGIMMLFAFGCNTVSDADYKSSQETLSAAERKSPLKFLSVSHTDKRNLFGQTVAKGVVSNSATMTTYQNIRLKLLYYNEAGQLVTNHEEVVDEPVKPGQEVKFKARYGTPKGTDSVAVSIMRAEVVADK